MSQYGFKLDFGRRGATITVSRLDKVGNIEYCWQAMLNSRGIQCERIDSSANETVLCDFESFLYPDRIEEGELDLLTMLAGAELPEDRKFLQLCSLLVAKWAAGHDEESFHEAISKTIKKWSE